MLQNLKDSTSFTKAIIPILVFILLLTYGLFIHPIFVGGQMLPLEVLILAAMTFSIFYLFVLGYKWKEIEGHILEKVKESVPVLLILFAVGVLIGSWIVSGTIPMLIHFGISVINPSWIYIFSFIICIVFSLLTGTSWGSAGTIGVVMMGIATVYDANLAITAAAIIGGSFFGDKMSPLSDTTNIASLATDVPVFQHIHSMLYTTGPAAIIAAIIYTVISINSGEYSAQAGNMEQIESTLTDLSAIFDFNILLLLPLLVVVVGSLMKKPIFITLLSSAWVAMILAIFFQSFSIDDILSAFKNGFNTNMTNVEVSGQSAVLDILNRGGLYNLIEGIVSAFLIFAFIGTLQVLNAVEESIKGIMRLLTKPWHLVSSTLLTTLVTNLTTSNQYATSFIIGEAFKKKYDKLGVHKKVLSRSIEDAGTMMENLAPWTPSGIFMASTLGISALEYAQYQYLSWVNIVIAFVFAFTGIACFKVKTNEKQDDIKS